MSLINQVLKDLDKRGASTNIGEATIRVVHTPSGRSAFWLILAGAAGMLVAGGAAWLVWQALQSPSLPPVSAIETNKTIEPNKPNEDWAASQVIAAPVQLVMPEIASVSPDPAVASGLVQTIAINGTNFKQGASANLIDENGGIYANRPIFSRTSAQIVLKLNLGKKTSTWSVEVQNNDGSAAARHVFSVKAPALIAGLSTEKPASASTKASIPDKPVMASSKASSSNPAPVIEETGTVNKSITRLAPQQQAENEFRRAYGLMQQGQSDAAISGYEAALKLDGGHLQARQMLVRLLLEQKRNIDAERVLQQGLQHDPKQSNLALLLARMQVGRNEIALALETMMKSLPYAETQPDYQAFVAALLQRQSRHKEAIEYYQNALQLKPQSGVWLMGMGISLRAEQRNVDARETFKRALESKTLNTELQTFVSQQLKEL